MRSVNKYRIILAFIGIFASLCIIMSVGALAADVTENSAVAETVETQAESVTESSDKRLGDIKGEDMSLGDRVSYAVQGTVTGLLMVFSVLALLWGIVSLSKVFLYDIPNKQKAEAKAEEKPAAPVPAPVAPAPVPAPVAPAPVAEAPISCGDSDAELAAVITAAIAAMLDGEEYKNEFASGFRVVSFKRVSGSGAWNKK